MTNTLIQKDTCCKYVKLKDLELFLKSHGEIKILNTTGFPRSSYSTESFMGYIESLSVTFNHEIKEVL